MLLFGMFLVPLFGTSVTPFGVSWWYIFLGNTRYSRRISTQFWRAEVKSLSNYLRKVVQRTWRGFLRVTMASADLLLSALSSWNNSWLLPTARISWLRCVFFGASYTEVHTPRLKRGKKKWFWVCFACIFDTSLDRRRLRNVAVWLAKNLLSALNGVVIFWACGKLIFPCNWHLYLVWNFFFAMKCWRHGTSLIQSVDCYHFKRIGSVTIAKRENSYLS